MLLCCVVLYCPFLHCSSLPQGINPFAVNDDDDDDDDDDKISIQFFVYVQRS